MWRCSLGEPTVLAAVASIEFADALDAMPRSAKARASEIMESQIRALLGQASNGSIAAELARLSREKKALARSISQRGQLGLGCNDVINSPWAKEGR